MFDSFHFRHLCIEEPSPHVVVRNLAIHNHHLDRGTDLPERPRRPRLAMGIWNIHHHRSGRGGSSVSSVLLESAKGQEDGVARTQPWSAHLVYSKAILHRGRLDWNHSSGRWNGLVPTSIQSLVIPEGSMAVGDDYLHDRFWRTFAHRIRYLRAILGPSNFHPIQSIDGPDRLLRRANVHL